MTKRRILALLVSGLFLAAGPLVGCGETDDPSVNAENDNNQNNDEQNNDEQNNDEKNTNNDDPECTINADCDGDQVCNDDGECEDPPPVEPVVCDDEGWFFGQITDSENVDYSGGIPTTDPLTEGTGLGEIWEALDAAWDPDAEDAIEVEFDPVVEVEATVIATSFIGDRRLYLQDQDGAMYFFRLSDEGGVPEDPHVGQRVSFNAERADIFWGNPQIRDFSDWTVIETPEEDQFVPYIQIEDEEITKEDHFYQNVRVVGWLGEEEDDSWECAGDMCYRMYYGSDAQHTITFKSGSDFVHPGDCVTYLGPVSTFPGYYEDNGRAQLDAENHDWWYATGSGGLDD